MPNFVEYMHESRAAADYFWALVSAVVSAGNLLVNKAASAAPEPDGSPSKEPPQYHAWHFSIAAASMLVAAAISVNRAGYLRARTGCLVGVKLLGFFTLGTLLQPYVALLPRVMLYDREPPATGLLRAALVAEQGLLLLLGALGWQMPLRTHLWVQAVGLLCMLSIVPRQCAVQCASPAYAAMYQRWTAWLSSACGRLFPVTVAARRDGPSSHPCLAVNGWALLSLGYVLPALYVHWAQWRLRQRYLSETGRARGAPDSEPWLSVWMHVGMAAVALPVAWRVMEVGVPLWEFVHSVLLGTGLAGDAGQGLGCAPAAGITR